MLRQLFLYYLLVTIDTLVSQRQRSLAVWPSVVLYGRSARHHSKQDGACMSSCHRTLYIATPCSIYIASV